jgi:hypothetical protein
MADLEQSPEIKPLPQYCFTCHWWNYIPEEGVQECRKSPPTRNLENTKCCFPPVDAMVWCGAWQEEKRDIVLQRKEKLKAQQASKKKEETK